MYSARRELPFESLRIFDGVERSVLKKRVSEAIPSFDTCPPEEDSTFDILRFCGSLLNPEP
jgi:hypothetical protein